MRKIILIVLTALCLLPCSLVSAQDNGSVKISTEKVRLDGKIYYSHLVMEKQTLYSISKAYGVSEDDIIKANPALNLETEGLKARQMILIPFRNNSLAEAASAAAASRSEAKDDDDYIEHITRWYETLGTLSFKYNIDVEILMKYNGLSSQNLSAKQSVRIPQGKTLERLLSGENAAEETPKTAPAIKKAEQAVDDVKPVAAPVAESKPVAKAEPAAEKKPEVKAESKPAAKAEPAAEKKPEVKVESKPVAKAEPVTESKPVAKAEPVTENKPVAKAEPAAESKPVAKAEPATESKPVAKAEPAAESKTEAKAEAVQEPETKSDSDLRARLSAIFKPKAKSEAASDVAADSKTVETALPEQEHAATADTVNTNADIFDISSTDFVSVSIVLPLGSNGNINNSNLDFYCGALLAAKDLEAEGIHTELKVFDLSTAMPLKRELEGSSLILGPVSPQDIEAVKAIAPAGAAVISPLDPKGLSAAKSLSDVIQAPSSSDTQNKDLVDWIKEDLKYGDKVILVAEKNAESTSAAEYLEQSGLEYDILQYGILEGRDITGSLSSLLTKTGTNRILIASEREAFVNDVIRNVNLMVFQKYDAIIYAPSRLRNFETIEVENLHNTGVHLSNSYYVDYASPKVKSFLYAYRALCGAEPTPFAYQGYDTAYYFIKQYAQFGPSWIHYMEAAKGLQSNFNFEHEEDAGYYNVGTRRVIYGPGYSTEVINRF